jgi:gamma-glutamylcyclotransferase (GGCT)/AIG2-like uncharacterized protein YtfP
MKSGRFALEYLEAGRWAVAGRGHLNRGDRLQNRETRVTDGEVPALLFAYGTLGPSCLQGCSADGWVFDRVRGRLYDLGPYPALVDWDDPEAGWVEGHVRPVDCLELEQRLDAYEGVEEGLYRRVALMTAAGRWVWAYVYPQPRPPGSRGPLERWGCLGSFGSS